MYWGIFPNGVPLVCMGTVRCRAEILRDALANRVMYCLSDLLSPCTTLCRETEFVTWVYNMQTKLRTFLKKYWMNLSNLWTENTTIPGLVRVVGKSLQRTPKFLKKSFAWVWYALMCFSRSNNLSYVSIEDHFHFSGSQTLITSRVKGWKLKRFAFIASIVETLKQP